MCQKLPVMQLQMTVVRYKRMQTCDSDDRSEWSEKVWPAVQILANLQVIMHPSLINNLDIAEPFLHSEPTNHQQPSAGGESIVMSSAEKQNRLFDTDGDLESISDCVFTVNMQWLITSFNRAAEEITGVKRSDAIGQLCSEVFFVPACVGSIVRWRRPSLQGDFDYRHIRIHHRFGGSRIPISISTALLRDAEGEVIEQSGTFSDLSGRDASSRILQESSGLAIWSM